jgi:hypothetical protein
MRRLSVATLVACALAVTVAGPAFAAKPETAIFEFQDSFDLDCGATLVHEEATVTVRQTLWFDADGNPVRALEHITYDGVLTGPGGIGSLADRAHFTNDIDIAPGDVLTVRQVGLLYSIQVPGLGLVAHDVGIITFFPDGSAVFKGPHDVFENGFEPFICGLFED